MIKKLSLAVMAALFLCTAAGCRSTSQETKAAEVVDERDTEDGAETEAEVENGAETEAASETAKETAEVKKSRGFFEEFAAEDLDGNPVDQEIFKDYDLTMINIWATFCGPCINEMPDLGELHNTWKEKGVQVVGLCTDTVNLDGTYIEENLETARLIVEETGADYLHIVPAGEVAGRLLPQIQVVPTTVFVDKDGKQITSLVTGSRSLEDWEEMVEKLLEKQ